VIVAQFFLAPSRRQHFRQGIIMAGSLKELLDNRANKFANYRDIIDRAEKDKRELSAEDRKSLDVLDGEIDGLSAKIEEYRADDKRLNRLAEFDAMAKESAGRQIGSSPPSLGQPGGDGASYDVQWRGQTLSFKAGSPEHGRGQEDYRKRFLSYVTGGSAEQLGLMVGSDPKGGYLVPMQWIQMLVKFLDDLVFIRQLATVIPLPGAASVGAPSWDTDPGDADWTPEVPAVDIAEDDTATVGKRELTPHLLTKLVKISMKLLRSNALLTPDTFLAQRLAYKFGITEEKAFLLGSGAGRPLGVFVASPMGISTNRDSICASATTFTADELINALFALKAAYQARSTWIFHRDSIKLIRKLKDGNGQYLWLPGIVGTDQDRILGRPYKMSEYAPNTFTTGLYVGIIGDFSHYWIVDSWAMEVQRLNELFSLRNQVGLLGRKETDAMPVLEEAFTRLRLA
jgi:HK97 family phage major capsid protein